MIAFRAFALGLGVALIFVGCDLHDRGFEWWATIPCVVVSALLVTFGIFPLLIKLEDSMDKKE